MGIMGNWILEKHWLIQTNGARVRATSVTPQHAGPRCCFFRLKSQAVPLVLCLFYFCIIILWERYH